MKSQNNVTGITKIYLVTNCYNNPNWVYIGKTINSREKPHKKTYGDQIEYTYIDEVNSLNRKEWEPLETYWIQQFISWGFNVLNVQKKGGGGPEYKTKDSKQKQSLSMLGRKQSEEHINNLSKSRKGRVTSEQTKQKIRESNKDRVFNEERNKKISEANKGKIKKGLRKPVEKYSLDGVLLHTYPGVNEALKLYSGVSAVLSGRTKSSGGYIWKYKII